MAQFRQPPEFCTLSQAASTRQCPSASGSALRHIDAATTSQGEIYIRLNAISRAADAVRDAHRTLMTRRDAYHVIDMAAGWGVGALMGTSPIELLGFISLRLHVISNSRYQG